MNNYFDRLIIYCFYCMKTRNLHYDSDNDNKIDYKISVVNYMFSKEDSNMDEDFVVIEKSK